MTPPLQKLPPELLEAATARLLAADTATWPAIAEELARAHPDCRDALHRLRRRLEAAERLLERSFPAPPPDDDLPDLGDYRVVRKLGEGAFGTVFLCEQVQPIVRRVAVKVLRAGIGDRHTLARFAAERQLLAALSHPAITPIHDAGHLRDGRPFFVMEFVDGVPIAAFCRARELDLTARLQLFVRLCHGVEHAHGRGIVHRDLKPENVLVVDGGVSGDEPQPKIIDFGVAKALAGDGDFVAVNAGPATDRGRVLGTPGYMSPEQAAGRADQVDARADVFALGVMLFELLTETLPWSQRRLGAGDHGQHDSEPPVPSERLAQDGDAGRRAAARVRGELDWITTKAMSHDRERRYASAHELADDVVRHLEHRPVLAGPPTLSYRLRRFVRRHRGAAAAFAAAALVAITAFAILAWRQRTDLDDAEATVARLLRAANDPAVLHAPQNDPIRRTLAAEALACYERWLHERPDEPSLRAGRVRALLTLADVHVLLGEAEAARRVAAEAVADADVLAAAAPSDVALRALSARGRQHQVRALHLREDYAASLPLCERAITDFETCAAARPSEFGPPLARALREQGLALMATGRHVASVAPFRRATALLERLRSDVAKPDALAADLVMARMNLAAAMLETGDLDGADAELERCVTELPAVAEDRERVTATVLCQQAQLSLRRGDAVQAIDRFQRGAAGAEAWVQREPKHLRARLVWFEAVRQLANVHESRGDWPAADASMLQAVTLGEGWLAAFPHEPNAVQNVRLALYMFARAVWNRFRRGDLGRAAAWLERCTELAPPPAGTGSASLVRRPRPWEVRSITAHVADADGRADDAAWDALAAELPTDPTTADSEPGQQVVEAWLGVARSRWRRGALAAVGEALATADEWLDADEGDDKLRAEAAWWRARLAIQRADWRAAAEEVAAVVRLRPSWWGHWRAGDAEHEAWQLLAGTDTGAAAAARDRAAVHYRLVTDALAAKVAAAPGDPWLVVPWGFAALGLAAIEADTGEMAAARTRAAAALAALDVVAAAAHRDLWDDARLAAGRALAARR